MRPYTLKVLLLFIIYFSINKSVKNLRGDGCVQYTFQHKLMFLIVLI